MNIEQYFYFEFAYQPMTHLFFFPDDQTVILLDSPLAPELLVASINSGQWTTPPAIAAILQAGNSIKAASFGKLVIILPEHPAGASFYQLNPAGQSGHRGLSPRQNQILQCLIDGLTTRQIALQLGLHPRTVQYHISLIKTYLRAGTRAESIGRAAGLGLVKGHSSAKAKLPARKEKGKLNPEKD